MLANKLLRTSAKEISRVSIMLLTLFCLYSIPGISQERTADKTGSSQMDNKELSSLLQFCIDMPEMQKYFPTNSEGNKKQVNIMRGPVQFTEDMARSNAEKNVSLFNRGDVQPEAYFIFRSIEKTGDTVKLNINYFYNHKGDSYKLLRINMELKKGTQNWEIINKIMEGDKL